MPCSFPPSVQAFRSFFQEFLDTAAVRYGLAPFLFHAVAISVASAAQIAGLPLLRFLEIFALLRLSASYSSAADLGDELSQARRWLGQTT